MKLVFNKSSLLQGISIVLKAVPSRTTMPILECILIDANSGIIKFTTNDMELGIETIVEGDIIERGMMAIDAKMISDIVRKLPDNEVMIETDSNFNAKITCEKAVFNIPYKNGEDFSYLPYIEKDKFITISQFSLKEIIRQTIFSIADSDSKKIMTGELFDVNSGILKVVSLDGHRISIRKIDIDDKEFTERVVVPGKTLIEISKILSTEVEDKVNIYFTNNHILFEFDNTKVVSRLIEGEYFRVEQMISTDYETKLNVNKKDLLSCIDRATLLIREGDKKPLVFNIEDGSMELKVTSPLGSMNENLDINKEGKNIMIGFNPRYLIDSLRVIDDEVVSIYLVNPKAPCFIKDDKDSFMYVILPVNFNQV